jgi:hypothetical protein
MNQKKSSKETEVFFVYDCELCRPGCVLLQAGLGGSASLAHEFPVESWLLAPTPGLKKYKLENREQLDKLIRLTKLSMTRDKITKLSMK